MCNMTRQHFQFIAEVMQRLPHDAILDRYDIIDLFADLLKRTNPAFNVERFKDACDVEPGAHVEDIASHNNRYIECFDPMLRPDKYDGVPGDTHSH